jgi:hypothetical protein
MERNRIMNGMYKFSLTTVMKLGSDSRSVAPLKVGRGRGGYKVDSWVPPPDLKGHKLKTQETFSLQTQATMNQCI